MLVVSSSVADDKPIVTPSEMFVSPYKVMSHVPAKWVANAKGVKQVKAVTNNSALSFIFNLLLNSENRYSFKRTIYL